MMKNKDTGKNMSISDLRTKERQAVMASAQSVADKVSGIVSKTHYYDQSQQNISLTTKGKSRK